MLARHAATMSRHLWYACIAHALEVDMAREKARRIRFRFADYHDSWWVTNEHVGGNTGWAVCVRDVTERGTLVKDLPSEEAAREWLRLQMVQTISRGLSDAVKRRRRPRSRSSGTRRLWPPWAPRADSTGSSGRGRWPGC